MFPSDEHIAMNILTNNFLTRKGKGQEIPDGWISALFLFSLCYAICGHYFFLFLSSPFFMRILPLSPSPSLSISGPPLLGTITLRPLFPAKAHVHPKSTPDLPNRGGEGDKGSITGGQAWVGRDTPRGVFLANKKTSRCPSTVTAGTFSYLLSGKKRKKKIRSAVDYFYDSVRGCVGQNGGKSDLPVRNSQP